MTIAGVDVGAMTLPEQDGRVLNRSLGIAAGGAMKIKKFRDPDNNITIILLKKTTTVKDNLITALLAAQTTTVVIAPDAHVNLGNGAGGSINAYWMDQQVNAQKASPDAWDITLLFRFGSIVSA